MEHASVELFLNSGEMETWSLQILSGATVKIGKSARPLRMEQHSGFPLVGQPVQLLFASVQVFVYEIQVE